MKNGPGGLAKGQRKQLALETGELELPNVQALPGNLLPLQILVGFLFPITRQRKCPGEAGRISQLAESFFDMAIWALEPLLQHSTIWEIRPFLSQLHRRELLGPVQNSRPCFCLVQWTTAAGPGPSPGAG